MNSIYKVNYHLKFKTSNVRVPTQLCMQFSTIVSKYNMYHIKAKGGNEKCLMFKLNMPNI